METERIISVSSDNQRYIFRYREGLSSTGHSWDSAQSLNPKSHNDVVLYFRPEDDNIKDKDIGSVFTFSFKYALFNPKDKSDTKYNVTFTDIKVQKN